LCRALYQRCTFGFFFGCSHFGPCKPGDVSHSFICEAVSACRARRINRSRSPPIGSELALSRRRFASVTRRSSRDRVCLMRRRCCMALLHA
jgi:hypothetical protein